VIHRDLKPANVLIDSQGDLFLTDFGIAKILESASPRLTQTDAILGTPAYISPEQAQAQQVDQRSDIYSLGIILYEMVTGIVPFTADTPLAVILKHVTHSLPLPSSIKPDIPEAIEYVILKALAKNPNDRFANVAEFISAWKQALNIKESASKRNEFATEIASHPHPSSASNGGTIASAATVVSQPKRIPARLPGLSIGVVALLIIMVLFIAARSFFSNSISSNATTDEFQISIGDDIQSGIPGPGAGLIESAGSKDIYSLVANPGQSIFVHIIEPPETNNNILFSMEDDLHTKIFSTCLQCGDPGLLTLERGGEYTLTVGDDSSSAGYGAYRFKIWNVPQPDRFQLEIGTSISKDKPGQGAGNIEVPGALDIYSFTATAGQTILFSTSNSSNTSVSIYWRLEDENKNQLFNTCMECGDPEPVTFDHDGKYFLIIGSETNPGMGSYEFSTSYP
jgi:hypothetical protein